MFELTEASTAVQQRGAVVAYIDTQEVFFVGRLPNGIVKRIIASHGKRPRIVPCTSSTGYVWGYRVIVHQPSTATIRVLEEFRVMCGGKICRADIAFDFPLSLLNWLERHAIMQWRRRGSMHEEQNGYYFVRHGDRDILLYWDRASKIWRGVVVAHFELRFKSAQMIRRQGWSCADALIGLNPRELFAKHVRLVDIDYNAVDQRINQIIKSCNPVLAHRLSWQFDNRLKVRERAQYVRDIFPDIVDDAPRIPIDILRLPDHLNPHVKVPTFVTC